MITTFLAIACTKDTEPSDKQPPPEPTHSAAPEHTGPTDTGTLPGPDLVATEENDGTLQVTYVMPELEVRSRYDALVTWSQVTTDGWGDPLVATAVPRLVLLEITVPPAQLSDLLARDALGFSVLSIWEADVDGQVFANLSDLASGGTAFSVDAYLLEDPNRSWVLGLADVDGERLSLRTAALLVPKDSSGATSARFEEGATTFSYTGAVDGVPLVTADAWEQWTVDWDQLGTDLLGRPYDDTVVDELFVARYTEPASELGSSLRDLTAPAEEVWRMPVGGFTDARLEFALDAGGGRFPGFTEGSTWILGGRCTTCLTPFPAFTFQVEVR